MKNDIEYISEKGMNKKVKVELNHASMLFQFEAAILSIKVEPAGNDNEIIIQFDNGSTLRFYDEEIEIYGLGTKEGNVHIKITTLK